MSSSPVVGRSKLYAASVVHSVTWWNIIAMDVTACMWICNLCQVPIWRAVYAGKFNDKRNRALDWQRVATYVEQRRMGRLPAY
jgi:hypothetical protein